MKFFVSFLLVAMFGSVGIYYGTQPLWAAMGIPLPSSAHPATGAPAPVTPQPYIQSATPLDSPTPAPVVRPIPAPSRMTETTPPAALAPAPVTEPVPASTTPPATEAPVSEAVTATTADSIPPPTPGSKSWGMTMTGVPYYTLSGENRGKLPGGMIMDIEDTRSTSKGDMSVGRVERDGTMAGPYLIANANLVIFQVSRGTVPPDTIIRLKQYYDLKGKLDQRVSDLKKQTASANPYTAAYGEAIQKYNDFGVREKQLTEKRDAAKGEERMRVMDQLRGMIPESKRLERAVEDAKTKYNKWKAANPETTTVATGADPQVLELQKKLSALEPQIKAIVQ